MTIFTICVIFFWIIFLLYWAVSATRTKKNAGSSWRWLGIRVILIIVLLTLFQSPLLAKLGKIHLVAATNPVLGILGVLFCGVGIAYAIWARTVLGKNWGMPMTVKEKPELVTNGPYRYVRHPIYTGVLVAVLGSALISGIMWFIPLVLYCIYFIYSARVEETNLMKEFPLEYPEYKKRTKLLIPYVL